MVPAQGVYERRTSFDNHEPRYTTGGTQMIGEIIVSHAPQDLISWDGKRRLTVWNPKTWAKRYSFTVAADTITLDEAIDAALEHSSYDEEPDYDAITAKERHEAAIDCYFNLK
jgi:hypothetical protein